MPYPTCPYCGADDPKRCEIEAEDEHVMCPWEQSGEFTDQDDGEDDDEF